jgi:ATP-dependent Clp protease ATP-binding subunit ClpA
MQINHTAAVEAVFAAARREAQSLNQPVVEPEHLLLALVNSQHCRVAYLLRRHHVDRDVLRTAIRAVLPYNEDPPTNREPALSPRSQRIVNYSRTVARQLGEQVVTTQSLLLSLLEDQGQRLARALREMDIDPQPLLAELAEKSTEVEH